MTSKEEGEKKRGPKGGIQHQPGRGHDAKSGPRKKERHQKKAAKRRKEREELARQQWEVWDQLTEEQKRFRPELKPSMPRPEHGH
jgi:hypothetical protein